MEYEEKIKSMIQPPIHHIVMEDIMKRAQFGYKKYGKFIKPLDGDDYLQHLYEELLDAAHYIKAIIEERKINGK